MILSSDNDSDDGAPPTRTAGTSSSPAKGTMPSSLTSSASLVQPGEAHEWIVRAGPDVPGFMYANGPARITQYNFNVVHERNWPKLVERRLAGAKPDYSDIFVLTKEGERANPSTLGWRVELACTGKSLYGKAAPNCRRVCCGGFGECCSDCEGTRWTLRPHHSSGGVIEK